MRFVVLVCLLSAYTLSTAAVAGEAILVHVGDSIVAVRQELGDPTIEFPLNGQLVQDFGEWVVMSRDGVVVSVKQRKDEKTAESLQEASPALTIQSLEKRAETGDADALYSLGYCYHSGTTVKKDILNAVVLYRRAAMQGHMAAQHNLGIIYMKGEGDVERDVQMAYTWACLAAENGNDSLMRTVRPLLTDEQAEAAMERAESLRIEIEKNTAKPVEEPVVEAPPESAPEASPD